MYNDEKILKQIVNTFPEIIKHKKKIFSLIPTKIVALM